MLTNYQRLQLDVFNRTPAPKTTKLRLEIIQGPEPPTKTANVRCTCGNIERTGYTIYTYISYIYIYIYSYNIYILYIYNTYIYSTQIVDHVIFIIIVHIVFDIPHRK